MRIAAWLLAPTLAALGGCYDDVRVVQGTLTAFDPQPPALLVRDERPPHRTESYRTSTQPAAEPGDLVRVAYREETAGRVVVRFMNVTRARAKAGKE